MFGLVRNQIIVDELRIESVLSRGVSEVINRDSLKSKLLSGRRLRVKLGIDPTSSNLHLGRSVILLKLRDFQELGHQVVLIIGDSTGVIGDTSDKESERPMLKKEQIKENAKTYFSQAGKILKISEVEKKFNSQWLSKLSYDQIGEQADQFSLADFIARENIKRRLDGGKRVSLREVLYPLMQAYDSVAVRADVEIGGTDQRFNLLAGRKLQEHFGQPPQDILTTNLIEGTDGRKMSSSWGNTINLLEKPSEMYGGIMRLPDKLLETYLVHVTRIPLREVTQLLAGSPYDAKMRLAHEVTKLYHGDTAAGKAAQAFVKTFSEKKVPDALPEIFVSSGSVLAEILITQKVVASKSEFRRLVSDGAVSDVLSKEKIADPEVVVEHDITLKVGKRRFIKISLKV